MRAHPLQRVNFCYLRFPILVRHSLILLCPSPLRTFIVRFWVNISLFLRALTSIIRVHPAAVNTMNRNRLGAEEYFLAAKSAREHITHHLPRIDVSVVTFNSDRWIDGFIGSLTAIDYPFDLIEVKFVDNASTDSTLDKLRHALIKLHEKGISAVIIQQPNRGFGAGHNVAISQGCAPFCLVTNIDLVFEADALKKVVSRAIADEFRAAAWELRQKPYEHPKYYDPVTHSTNWNSHACLLLRREAFDRIGGYDENIFMYGEDVEFSYRLRNFGYVLRYCPDAVVWHYPYEDIHQCKPLQDYGSKIANIYLRFKFGNLWNIAAVPILLLAWLLRPQPYRSARYRALLGIIRIFRMAPKAIGWRRQRNRDVYFPFNMFNYDIRRDGAFFELKEKHSNPPLISIITRTYPGRELYLQQALLSVRNQTYGNLEHIIVEDGGNTHGELVGRARSITDHPIRYMAQDKVGRSKAGNVGLSHARGEYCLFLDDDDLLFADHVEVLVDSLLRNPDAFASYSLAWEVATDTRNVSGAGAYREMSYILLEKYKQEFNSDLLVKRNYLTIQSVLFKRVLFLERGGMDESLDALEDWNLWIRYSRNVHFVYVPKLTSLYRIPSDSKTIANRLVKFVSCRDVAVKSALSSPINNKNLEREMHS